MYVRKFQQPWDRLMFRMKKAHGVIYYYLPIRYTAWMKHSYYAATIALLSYQWSRIMKIMALRHWPILSRIYHTTIYHFLNHQQSPFNSVTPTQQHIKPWSIFDKCGRTGLRERGNSKGETTVLERPKSKVAKGTTIKDKINNGSVYKTGICENYQTG